MNFPKHAMLPDAIFWDWDGTIVDSYSYLNDAHNYTLEKLGFERFKGDEYRQYFGKPREILYPAIYKDKADQALDIFEGYVFEHAHEVQLIDGAEVALNWLHARDIPMAIVSNKKANFIAEELKHKDFGHCFSFIVGAGEAEADKPSDALLRLAVDKMDGVSRGDNIWFVGDTENDLLCAQKYGAKALFLKDCEDSQRLIEEYSPFISFDDYEQLNQFLVAI